MLILPFARNTQDTEVSLLTEKQILKEEEMQTRIPGHSCYYSSMMPVIDVI